MPASRVRVGRSAWSKRVASSATNSGTAAIRIAASDELTCTSPKPSSGHGTAISTAANTVSVRQRAPRPRSAPSLQATGSSTSRGEASRDHAMTLGETSSTAILMNRYGMPQITETAANSAQAACAHATPRPAPSLAPSERPAATWLASVCCCDRPAERGVHAAYLPPRLQAQQLDDVGGPVERVRDGLAVQEPERRPELAAYVGEQRRPVRGAAVVERGQPPDRGMFASAGE